MTELVEPRAEVHRLLRRHAPAATSDVPLADELTLAEDGLGLDSVGLVELLLACEDLFGAGFAASILADAPLTVGKLVALARRCRGEERPAGTP